MQENDDDAGDDGGADDGHDGHDPRPGARPALIDENEDDEIIAVSDDEVCDEELQEMDAMLGMHEPEMPKQTPTLPPPACPVKIEDSLVLDNATVFYGDVPNKMEALQSIEVIPSAKEALQSIEVIPSAKEALQSIEVIPSAKEALQSIEVIPSAKEALQSIEVIPSAKEALQSIEVIPSAKEALHSIEVIPSASSAKEALHSIEVIPSAKEEALHLIEVIPSAKDEALQSIDVPSAKEALQSNEASSASGINESGQERAQKQHVFVEISDSPCKSKKSVGSDTSEFERVAENLRRLKHLQWERPFYF